MQNNSIPEGISQTMVFCLYKFITIKIDVSMTILSGPQWEV